MVKIDGVRKVCLYCCLLCDVIKKIKYLFIVYLIFIGIDVWKFFVFKKLIGVVFKFLKVK